MSYILIAVYIWVNPGYTSSSGLAEQSVPVRLGEFKTLTACQAAAKEVAKRVRGGSYVMCAATDDVREKNDSR